MEESYLIEKKIEYILDMKVGKLQNALNEAVRKISQLSEEVEVLKNKVQRLNLGVSPQTKLVAEESQSAGKKEEKKEAAGTARTGNFKPGDVAIDKMFYFGNKR